MLYNKNLLDKTKNMKLSNQEIEDLKINLSIDVVRRKLIEDFLNSRKKILTEKTNIEDLIYNYNLSYITLKEKDVSDINFEKIKNREDFNSLKKILTRNNINFFFKNNDINESAIISNLIKELIKNNQKIKIEYKNRFVTLISLEKNLESYEGIFVKLISFNTSEIIEDKDLNCLSIKKLMSKKTIYKEYEYKKLNEQIQKNLKSINDYVIYNENSMNNYIFLCELRYDEKLLNTINFNKKVDWLANKIKIKFLNKYKNEYKYQKIK